MILPSWRRVSAKMVRGDVEGVLDGVVIKVPQNNVTAAVKVPYFAALSVP
jgi:hypothetical protein